MPKFKDSTVREFDFYFPELDTHLRVEASAESVTIRTTRDNISERRKHYFIHELASEGFIEDGFCPVDWVIDSTWLKIPHRNPRTDRFMLRLLIVTGVMCLMSIGISILGAP